MSYSSKNKEASPPQIQYSDIQSTERNFQVKSGDQDKKYNIYQKLAIFLSFVVVVMVIIIIYTNLPPKPKQITPINVAIMGTNDLNGKVYPTKLIRPDTKQSYNYGGLATLLTLRNIVAKQYNGNFLYLDAGDSVVGGIQTSSFVSSGQIMNDFFKSANLTASTFGDHQINWGTDFILSYLKGRQTPNLAANIKPIPNQWIPNHKNSMISNLQNGINAEVARESKSKDIFQFDNDYAKIVLNQSKELKSQGANAIVLIAHMENKCDNNFSYGIWTNQSNSSMCPGNQLFNLIDKLPVGTIDAVIQGHSHAIVHNYYKGIPIMGTNNGGYYTNFLYLNFDESKKLINSSVEGPVPICQKVFQNTKRCEYVEEADISKAGKLIPWKFHGVDVTPSVQFNQIIKSKWDQNMSTYRNQFLVNTEITLAPGTDKEYELGNLFTNLLHLVVPDADFVILDTKIFRSQWYPGPINQDEFFNMFPFNNSIATFTMTGSDLIQSLNEVKNIFFPVWNIQPIFKISKRREVTSAVISYFKPNEILPAKIYKGVSVSFTYEQGNNFFHSNTLKRIQMTLIGDFRQKVKPYLKKYGTIKKGALIDPLKPRAIVQFFD